MHISLLLNLTHNVMSSLCPSVRQWRLGNPGRYVFPIQRDVSIHLGPCNACRIKQSVAEPMHPNPWFQVLQSKSINPSPSISMSVQHSFIKANNSLRQAREVQHGFLRTWASHVVLLSPYGGFKVRESLMNHLPTPPHSRHLLPSGCPRHGPARSESCWNVCWKFRSALRWAPATVLRAS
jgi:hypothetical protein